MGRGPHGEAQRRHRWQWEASEGPVVMGVGEVTGERWAPLVGGEINQIRDEESESAFPPLTLLDREAEIPSANQEDGGS